MRLKIMFLTDRLPSSCLFCLILIEDIIRYKLLGYFLCWSLFWQQRDHLSWWLLHSYYSLVFFIRWSCQSNIY